MMSDYCVGCGMDMWEYEDEADWCIACAPECFGPGGTWLG